MNAQPYTVGALKELLNNFSDDTIIIVPNDDHDTLYHDNVSYTNAISAVAIEVVTMDINMPLERRAYRPATMDERLADSYMYAITIN